MKRGSKGILVSLSYPQLGLPDELAVEQLAAAPLQHHASRLEHVASSGEVEGGRHVLLDEEHGQSLRAVNLGQRFQDRVHEARHDPEARLVEHEEAWPRHEGAGDGQHLSLPAAESTRTLARALSENGKEGVGPV